ncbi:prepilin peptidase [Xylanimonas ulmi]|uniref:Leader peptidase (Prepilin peptidase)/N-methyltransferase n=1 Tax=Xylanimonas ulmi TaxID=228973 RepID=A0A4Q7M602_9MICO|nr:A24 family peptidase [Xylanibacterium ulmi]RZS63094.1 leader peptidase (prepilin peptidase)/N-methyltransferase [Xylanibacterium ulmi]
MANTQPPPSHRRRGISPRGTPRILARLPGELAGHGRAIVPLAAAATVWAVWASGPGWATPGFVVVAVAGAAHGVIDARTHRLPDAITLPAIVLTLGLLALAALATADGPRLGAAIAGAVVLGAAYGLLHLVNRSGLGLGDVKLAPLLGLPAGWCGWTTVWWAGALPFLLGGVAALTLLVTRRASRNSAIALGPWMLLGAGLALSLHRLAS